MFSSASVFNQDISNWDTASVTDMSSMFDDAGAFNQDIGGWNTASVTDMSYMFQYAGAFNQDIGSWNIGAVTEATDMFYGVTLSTANYDALLQGWDTQTLQSSVPFSGGNSQYCAGKAARAHMISADGWTITDGGAACTAPTVTTNAATSITSSGATLNGTVNANNDSTTVTFEYGSDTSYGTTVSADQSPVTGTGATPVSATLSGLSSATIYHFRLVGQNGAGTTYGADQTFTTQKKDQAITFPAIADKTYLDPDFDPGATASSSLAVSYSASGNCSILSGKVHITGVGSCTVTASQAGSDDYNPAQDMSQSFNIAKASQTIDFPAIPNKTYGDLDFDPGATASSGLVVSYSASGNCTILSGKVHLTAAGSCTVTASQAGNGNYFAAASVSRSFTIAGAATSLSLGLNPTSVQYSDQTTFTATITPYNLGGDLLTGSVEFFVNNASVGSAALNSSGIATLSLVISSAPNSYAVTAKFTSTNANFAGSNGGPVTLTVTPEDARAYYTGNTLFWGTTSTATSATVTLAATIKDITAVMGDPAYDTREGDIRNAQVTFMKDGSPVSGCKNLAVALVSTSDTRVGTVTCSSSFSIASSGATQSTIGIQVNNYYTRYTLDEAVVIDVAQPLTSNFITGGGHLVLTNSTGQYAGTAGSKVNYGFNVKYNKKGTNLQGGLNIIFRSGGKVYQIKSNAMTSLGVKPSPCSKATLTQPCTANFVSKANLTDVTNPAAPISLGGNLTLQVQMTDKGDPGSSDMIAFALYNGSALLFSSNWSGTKTVEQLLGGGNLVVH
jgi:surface protein